MLEVQVPLKSLSSEFFIEKGCGAGQRRQETFYMGLPDSGGGGRMGEEIIAPTCMGGLIKVEYKVEVRYVVGRRNSNK